MAAVHVVFPKRHPLTSTSRHQRTIRSKMSLRNFVFRVHSHSAHCLCCSQSAIKMGFLWNWLLQVAVGSLCFSNTLRSYSQFRFLRVQPTLLVPEKHRLQELNDDVLREIFAAQELGLEDRLQVSLVSHRFRTLVRPLIFSQCTWSPWLGACSFLPQTLWAHIR
jgi:hypothetical protein